MVCEHNWCLDQEGTHFNLKKNCEWRIFICSECGSRKRKLVLWEFIEDEMKKGVDD